MPQQRLIGASRIRACARQRKLPREERAQHEIRPPGTALVTSTFVGAIVATPALRCPAPRIGCRQLPLPISIGSRASIWRRLGGNGDDVEMTMR